MRVCVRKGHKRLIDPASPPACKEEKNFFFSSACFFVTLQFHPFFPLQSFAILMDGGWR